MPSHKTYTIEQYEAFLAQPFSNNFGISEESCANWFVNQAGARPVMNSYGVNKSNLLSTYIPRLKESFDGGYFLFLAITVTEGGGAGNWLNHYGTDTSSGGLNTMNDDIEYVKYTFKKTEPPAYGAPEVFNWTPYTEDKAGETQRVYDSVPSGSLGSYFIPSTMAGNAWVFGEQWCLNNQGAGPPYVYFGNPYDDIINTIKSTGADPFGTTPAKPNPDPPPKHDTPKEDLSQSKNDQKSDLVIDYKKLAEQLIKLFQDALNHQVYSISDQNKLSNQALTITRTYGNTYKVDYTSKLLDTIKGTLNTKDTGQNQSGAGQQDKKPDGSNNKPPSISSGKTDNGVMKQIADWCEARQGQSFDYDGVYGAQCVDLGQWINREFKLGLNFNNNPNYGGEGMYAKRIWENPLPDDWERVQGDTTNDTNAVKIWNSLPVGCVVWFTNAWAGHIGFKAGDNWLTYNQNVDDIYGNGGPLRKTDLSSFIAGGAGFLGAWVKKG